MGFKSGFRKLEKKLKRRKPVEAGHADVWGTGRARENQRTNRIPETLRGSSPSFGSGATPDDSQANVSRADRGATRSLKGPMIHRFPKTLRGKSVVPDKPDKSE